MVIFWRDTHPDAVNIHSNSASGFFHRAEESNILRHFYTDPYTVNRFADFIRLVQTVLGLL